MLTVAVEPLNRRVGVSWFDVEKNVQKSWDSSDALLSWRLYRSVHHSGAHRPAAMAPSRAQKDEIVQMGGKTLKRVMDNETRQWVYRPVDESSGKVISKEAFEAMKREEAKARWESDPKRQAEQDKKWAAQQRSEIRGARIADAKQMKKNEHVRKLKSGLVEPSRPRRREIASVAVPKILADLREEMRVAAANGMDKRNPGQFAFIKTALDAEEAKHDAAVKATAPA